VPDPPVPPEEIRQQVARIIGSAGFGRSDLLGRFLRFIVESALSGEAEKLKEWVIGVEAYGRGPDFDPRVDSIVRTEARRLRRKLSEYYLSEGRDDPVIIELPTGSYEPLFRRRQDGVPFEAPADELAGTLPQTEEEEEVAEGLLPVTEGPPHALQHPFLHRLWPPPNIVRYLGAILLTCGLWFVYENYFASHRDPIHRIALLPVNCVPDAKDCEALGNAFIRALGTDLDIAGALNIVEPAVAAQATSRTAPITQIGSQLKVDHVFRADLEKSGDSWYLAAQMIRTADERPVWSGGFDCSWGSIAMDESQILNDILSYASSNSTDQDVRSALLQARKAEVYRLYARAEYAFATFTVLREKVYSDYAQQQLNQILRVDPEFNDARIVMARLNNERMWGAPDRAALSRESRLVLETAVKLEPKRADALALLAGVYWDLGQKEQATELARRALQLGPIDSIVHAEIGRMYTEAGFFESAIAETTKATALDPTNLRPLGFQIICLSWLGRQSEAAAAVNRFQKAYPGIVAELFAADQQLRARDFEAAGRSISAGSQIATAESRPAFDIAEGLRAALMGNRSEANRVFEQYKNSPPRFWDHLILLAAQLGQAESAVQLIRQNPLYFNYHYLAVERRLAPLYGDPSFQAALFDSYAAWQRDLSRYRSELPALPPSLPSPAAVLSNR
jgi:TolB-like protein